MMISINEILILYSIIFLLAGVGKSYRDLFAFRPQLLKLPKWGKIDDGNTNDSWHYGDGYNDFVSMFIPFAYLSVRVLGYEWYWSLLIIAVCFLWYWLEYYQVFLWCYHYFFNKADERYRIFNGYKKFLKIGT
jgi:hypothetical protein